MILRVILLFSLFGILSCSTAFAQHAVVLDTWQFHQGDLTVDSKGSFVFDDRVRESWIPLKLDKRMNSIGGVYWLKTRLPGISMKDMHLIFTTSANDIEVYLEGVRIYCYGDFQHTRKTVEFVRHSVPLPLDSCEKTVFLRVRNSFSNLAFIAGYTGFTNYFSKIRVDSLEHYQQNIINHSDNSEKYLGYIFVFIGIVAMIVALMVKEQTKAILYFSGLTFCGGLYLITHNRFAFGNPIGGAFSHYVLTVGFYLLPFFVCGFVMEYFEIHNDRVLSFFYRILVIHPVIILVLDILGIAPLPLLFNVFLIVTLLAILYIMLSLIKFAIKGDSNAKVVVTGFLLASAIWVFDLYKWITTPEYYTNQPILNVQWGIFIFNLAIGYVLTFRYIDSHKRVFGMNRELLKIQENMVITLGEVAEARSGETGEHIKRVADISVRLAAKYGFKDDDLELIKLASPMHDIGKVAIPDYILNKPGRLSEDEFDIIKTHARVGYDILIRNNQRIMNAAAIIALQHHEKYNGKGYPDGLKGEEIHIFARITAIADVFDALISERVYKKAYTIPEALEMIRMEKGQHFDPALVELFMQVAEELFPEEYRLMKM